MRITLPAVDHRTHRDEITHLIDKRGKPVGKDKNRLLRVRPETKGQKPSAACPAGDERTHTVCCVSGRRLLSSRSDTFKPSTAARGDAMRASICPSLVTTWSSKKIRIGNSKPLYGTRSKPRTDVLTNSPSTASIR